MTDVNERVAGLSPEKRKLLMQRLAQHESPPASTIGGRARPDRLPLSSAQQRLWVLDQFDPGSAVYNVSMSMWLDGQLDRGVFAASLAEIVRRHESLRTVVLSDDAGPYQLVRQPGEFVPEFHDLRGLAADAAESQAMELARAEARRPFHIDRGPMLRVVAIRVSEHRHLVVFNAHHIAIDGWSLGLLLDELRQIHDAFTQGRSSPLPELDAQYVDYTLWQREELASDGMRRQLEYWQQRLSGRLPVLELPGDRTRPASQSFRGEVCKVALPAELHEGIKRLARDSGATPFMVVLAAWQILLMRYSGQTDVVVGAGVANRRRKELEPLIGFFVNTLALRTDLSGDPTFRELLARVREVTLGAFSNQDVPIESVIGTLDLERAASHSPLFQTMLFYQNFAAAEASPSGLTRTPVHFDRINAGVARCDISLFVAELDGSLSLFFEYATDLFDEETVFQLAAHFAQIVGGAAAAPDTNIGDIDLLTGDERERVLRGWNATASAQAATTVHGLIESQCARTPDAVAVAVEAGEQALSYAELDAQANALSGRLAAAGVNRGALVAVMTNRTPGMLVALLGILKAGAAYVPLDPAFPHDRLAAMIEDSAATVLVTERALRGVLPGFAGTTVLLDPQDGVQSAACVTTRQVDVSANDLAYVIFTSGSTGRPKGVAITHAAAANFLQSMAVEPGMHSTDVVCAVTTLSFDIAVLELLLPLTVGARVELVDRDTSTDGAALASRIEKSGATVMQATPATWRMLLDSDWRGRPGLRILCGGEALPRDLATRLGAVGSEVWNMYGPTETTVWSTIERLAPGSDAVRVGHPIANTQIYIVDRKLRPVPAGVPGELLIGGSGVARGYLRRASQTAEKFVPDVFGDVPGARLYRSGDLARWGRDGRIEILGRIDNQIKLRGFRIEPGEIEANIIAQGGVREAAVICREDRPGDRRLVAYITGDRVPGADAMRAALRANLPDYMVPSAFVILDSLPLTPNGKLDRQSLPPPVVPTEVTGATQPRSADEEQLASLWAEVLGVESIGIHDDFFALGGHSLLATQLLTRVQRAFGGDIPLRMLFEAPTIAGFSELLIRNRMESVGTVALAGILDQLEGLSDAEIDALLGAELPAG